MARKIICPLTFHVTLPGGTAAAELVTDYVPGFRGKITGWQYVANVAATGAGGTRSFNLEIGTTAVTGSATTINLADIDAAGEVKACSAPTALNEFDADDTLSIVSPAAGAVAFTAGSGTFVLLLEQSARGI